MGQFSTGNPGQFYIGANIREGEREVLGLWIADSRRGHKTCQGTVLPDHGARF